MPGGSTESLGNILFQAIYVVGSSAGVSTPSVGANTSVTTTYSFPGILPNDMIDLQAQTHVAGLSIASAWCSTANVLTVQFVNSTTGTIGVQTNYLIIAQISRFEKQNMGISFFPSAIT